MTTRRTARGDERTAFEDERPDVLICGASFAGLAVARELRGSGADVLVIDRYEVGERATSACACPTPWLEALGLEGSIRQELPYMSFTTPHASVRYRLPWSWSAFDYPELCRLLFEQTDARFETAKVNGRSGRVVHTDRGDIEAPLIVDALGWRRVLSGDGYQPPDAPLSRGLEFHAVREEARGDALDCWVERDLVRRGYGWCVPAGEESRIGVGSYDPTKHVRKPTDALGERLEEDGVHYQGNWFPHYLREGTEDGVFFVGDSAGMCFPLSGEGIRTAFYFGIAAGRELRAVVGGDRASSDALANYGAFVRAHRRPFKRAFRLQQLVPALPPRVLSVALKVIGNQRIVDRSFGWYLDQAHPSFAAGSAPPVPAGSVG